MIWILSILLALPLGALLAHLTRDEKKIYNHQPYFPLMIPLLALLTIIMFIIEPYYGKVCLFILATIYVWSKA